MCCRRTRGFLSEVPRPQRAVILLFCVYHSFYTLPVYYKHSVRYSTVVVLVLLLSKPVAEFKVPAARLREKHVILGLRLFDRCMTFVFVNLNGMTSFPSIR